MVLRFFYTFQNLPQVKTPKATPFTLKSAEKFRNKTIPFQYIYITSVVYFRKIQQSLDDLTEALKVMNQAQEQVVFEHPNFPKELNTELQSSGENTFDKLI